MISPKGITALHRRIIPANENIFLCCRVAPTRPLKTSQIKNRIRQGALEINHPNGRNTHTYLRLLLLFISDFDPSLFAKKAIDRSHQNILRLLHYPVYILMRQK